MNYYNKLPIWQYRNYSKSHPNSTLGNKPIGENVNLSFIGKRNLATSRTSLLGSYWSSLNYSHFLSKTGKNDK